MKSNVLQYNGAQYHISVKIFSPTSTVEYDNIKAPQYDVLLWDNIQKLEFENDITNILLTGELVYKDNSNSSINKFLTASCKYVDVTVKKLKNTNNVALNDVIQEDIVFNHIFLVTSIDKIDEQNDLMYYSLKLVSQHWWNFNCNVNYSTHNATYNSKESPILILQKLYNQCGLVLDLNNIHTKALVDFISDSDENLNTSQNYLLKRAYSLESLESPGMLKVVYDYITNKYVLWSLSMHSGDKYVKEIYPKLTADEFNRNSIQVLIYNKYMDSLQNQDATYLDIVNFKSETLEYPSEFAYTYHSYDYDTNTFTPKDVTNNNIVESLPYIKQDKFNFAQKHFKLDNMLSKKNFKGPRVFNRSSSQWDESHWSYHDLENILLNNGIVRINTSGNLLRKPGDNTFLTVDSSDFSSLLNLKGDWINMRVVHTFTQTSYRNSVLLSRLNICIEEKNDIINARIQQ